MARVAPAADMTANNGGPGGGFSGVDVDAEVGFGDPASSHDSKVADCDYSEDARKKRYLSRTDLLDFILDKVDDLKWRKTGKSSGLTRKAFDGMCKGAQEASSVEMLGAEAGFMVRRKSAKTMIKPFLKNVFNYEAPSKWQTAMYKFKGLAAGVILYDRYKWDYLNFRGNIAELRGHLSRLEARVAAGKRGKVRTARGSLKFTVGQAPMEEIFLGDKDVTAVALFLVAIVAQQEDLLRMSAAPVDKFANALANKLGTVAMEWGDAWEHTDFGRENNIEKVIFLGSAVALVESLAETVKLAIEANDASTFKVFLVLLNVVTFIGTWFYGYVVPQEYACTVETCDTLLEKSLNWTTCTQG